MLCAAYDIPIESTLFETIEEVLTFMGDEEAMRLLLGIAAAERLKRGGHLAHWQRETATFRRCRPQIEENLLGRTQTA